jgi:hypothetical protein
MPAASLRTTASVIATLFATLVAGCSGGSQGGGHGDGGSSEAASVDEAGDDGGDLSDSTAATDDGGGTPVYPDPDAPEFSPDGCALLSTPCVDDAFCCSGHCIQNACVETPRQP